MSDRLLSNEFSARRLNGNSFGPMVHDSVMKYLLASFLDNMPVDKRQDTNQICLRVEKAHWRYQDMFCSTYYEAPKDLRHFVPCDKVKFDPFLRQVFHECTFLGKWRHCIKEVMSEFCDYKSKIPRAGLIMLNWKLTHVLLVQSKKGKWSLPKGRIEEGEKLWKCAIREGKEEVGFDATKYINKHPPIEKKLFGGKTKHTFFFATNVPTKYPFKPQLPNEIKNIAWFLVRDLLNRYPNTKGEDRFSNVAVKFAKDITDFAEKEKGRRERNKPTMPSAVVGSGNINNGVVQPTILIPPRSGNINNRAVQPTMMIPLRSVNINNRGAVQPTMMISPRSANINNGAFQPMMMIPPRSGNINNGAVQPTMMISPRSANINNGAVQPMMMIPPGSVNINSGAVQPPMMIPPGLVNINNGAVQPPMMIPPGSVNINSGAVQPPMMIPPGSVNINNGAVQQSMVTIPPGYFLVWQPPPPYNGYFPLVGPPPYGLYPSPFVGYQYQRA